MKKVLLISEKQIKEQSIIEQNVDSKILSKVIQNVQEIKLKGILGSTLYTTIIGEVVKKVEDNTYVMEALHTDLLNNYIQPYLVHEVLVDFLIVNNYKVTNKGTLKMKDDLAEGISMSELETAKDYYENYAVSYKAALLKFLSDNKLLEKGADTNTTGQATGWFVETTEGGYFYQF